MSQEDTSEILIDGSPHPAAAFTDPRQKWKAHVAYTRDLGRLAARVTEEAEEAVRQVLIKRDDLKKVEKPSDAQQQELIDAFDIFADGNIEHHRHGVIMCVLSAEEAYADAIHAMDNIADKIRKGGGNVSFTRQRARRAKLATASATVERNGEELHNWARKEKRAVKRDCPDYERLRPKFTVVSSAGDLIPGGDEEDEDKANEGTDIDEIE